MKQNTILTVAVACLLLVTFAPLHAADSPTARFTGTVTGPDGKPLAQAQVLINRLSGAHLVGDIRSLNALTDTNGAYDFPLQFKPADPSIECELWFDKKGYVRVKKQIVIPPTNSVQTLDATLHPGLVLSGVIRFDFSKRELEANPALRELPNLFKVTGQDFKGYYVTEKGGAFEVYVPPGEYRIAAKLGNQSLELTNVHAGSTNLVLEAQPFIWSEKSVGKVFDDLWQTMDLHYSYFFLKKDVDWQALKDQYRPQAIQAKNTAELAKVLQQMLAPLQDMHVWIDSPDGPLPTYSSSYQFNGNGKVTRGTIQDATQVGKFSVVGKTKEGFGYFLMLRQSNANPENVKQVIAAIEKLRDAPGFIVDLRTANGGSEPLAQEIAQLFCAKDTVYAKSKYRNDPGHDSFTQEFERTLKASEQPYTRPVVCLIGPGAVSSGEGFVKMMKCLPQVTTVGMPTRGASGNPEPFRLQGTGLEVMFSRWVDLLPNGQTFEGRGIPPDVKVDESPSAYAKLDPTLEKGLEVLRQKIKETKPTL